MTAYRSAIAADRPATVRGRALSVEDRLRARVIERLMCDLRVDVGEICRAQNMTADHFAAEFSKLDELAKDGIVERRDTLISVPPDARAFVRTICSVFDQYTAANETRHSRAS